MKFKPFVAAAIAVLFIGSCTKDSKNPLFDNVFLTGAYLTLESTTNVNFNTTDLSSAVGITVGSVGNVDKVNLFVVDDASVDQTWKLIKTIDYTGEGTVISATGQEIADALGYSAADFLPGTTLTMYNQVVTPDGKTYDITNAGPNVEAPDFNSSFSWTVYVVCPFTGGMAGDYLVIEDGWADYSPGTIITNAVEDGPGPNQITLHVYPNPAFGDPINPIIVDIDPATGTAYVPPVAYGDYGVIISAQGALSDDYQAGYVFSCTGYISLTLNHFDGDPSNTYGNYTLVLQKQ